MKIPSPKSSLTLIGAFFISAISTDLSAQSDACSAAPLLNSAPTCSNISGSLTASATYTTIPTGCSAASNRDVWYSFVAKTTNPTVTISSSTLSNTRIQVFSGSCASLTSVACGTTSVALTGLTIGATYFIRIYSTTASATGTFNICVTDPAPANDLCGGAVVLSSSTTCNNVTGNLYASTLTSPTNVAAPNCAGTVVYDVWYRFVAQTTSPTITLSNIGTGFASPNIQLMSNNCGGTFTALYCGTTSIAAEHLTIGATYFIRVYSSTGTSPANGSNMNFDICVTDPVTPPPYNDECANAINLPISGSCSNILGTVAGATSSAVPVAPCTGPANNDVWYKFTAVSASTTLTISGFGANFTNQRLQLFSGSCGALTSLACGTTTITNATTVGTTYFVRVYSTTVGSAPNGNANFNICASGVNAPLRFGNSYVNLSKKTTGGVVQTGDTLEIRMTVNHTSGTIFSPRYVDNIPTNTAMLTGAADRIRIITNEGLAYKQYTLAGGDDAATYTAAPPPGQYNIRLNLGFGGYEPGVPLDNSNTEVTSATGQAIATTHRPRGGGGMLFAIAYRVVVTGTAGDTITLNPGQFIYRTSAGGPDVTLTATPFNILITNTLTLCTNSIGLNNAVEDGGTFGSGTTLSRQADLTNPIAGYSFAPNVGASVQIGDGRYGIVKNMSPRNSTNRNARRRPDCAIPSAISTNDPNSCDNRMFSGHWAIDGDHSGTNNSIGNLPPAKDAPGGYMLLVNADFVASEAYRQTISNLCPNTYYEFSAWFRNVCTNCGADSTGAQFTGTSTAPASGYPGVYPNLTFAVDGLDYYSTGEIDTVGWIKKGFVIRTGPTQTSATFTIRNNSQGGGGNDWAMDDISVSTCLPTMTYSPSTNPTLCTGNMITIRDTVRSYFNTYTNFKWQRSTNGGSSWTDITGAGTATPVFNGSEYEYIVTYSLPPSQTQMSNDGDMYRVVVGTTASNLYDANCNFTDGIATITLRIISCTPALDVSFLSFNGKMNKDHAALTWSTTKEKVAVAFEIEKSTDGVNFVQIGRRSGNNNPALNSNQYTFNDSAVTSGSLFYRMVMVTADGRRIQSHIIALKSERDEFALQNLINPFGETLSFDVLTNTSSTLEILLLDATGHVVKKKQMTAYAGVNHVKMDDVSMLTSGVYIVQVRQNEKLITRKVIKR